MSTGKYSEQECINFVKNLILFQREKALTNADIASVLEVSPTFICSIRNGRQKPSERIIKGVSDLSGIKVADLLEDPDNLRMKEWAAYGKRLRKARKNRGMTQVDVANYLGVPKLVYVEMEEGKCSTTEDFKKKLDKLFFAEITVYQTKPEYKTPSDDEKPAQNAAPETAEIPLDIIDVVIKHVKDLKVSEDIQRKIFRSLSEYQLAKREETLFGGK